MKVLSRQMIPSASELTARIARCVGVWETNRGGDNPAPKESALDTVAGVHASMATIEQATMPYAVDAFAKYPALRAKASPALTTAEITAASACCKSVVTLLANVKGAATAGKDPADFIKGNAAAIKAACLDDGDVGVMFQALVLKGAIDKLRADVAAKKTTLDKAAASIPAAQRLGLGIASLKAYIRTAPNWGENTAGWQRKAVSAMPNQIGARIESVATSQNGEALALPVIGDRVNAELKKRPAPTEQQIVATVAQENNPGEANYGQNVLKIYNRLFPSAPG